ncbi:LVIVD repeat-containing protein [Chitinophaga sp. XS-30]|uniref:LVIVD repeat-containing protein n=1 Tax=Chitinophaga sp. XS-30 TaxID=2604421 RepID=UPI0011DCB385|nr:hypothetical protein [Chitinophaga sp. XS-30]QEH40324.1 hypothetical protein FW415_05325 [Chitinophaga sp. XS-30]
MRTSMFAIPIALLAVVMTFGGCVKEKCNRTVQTKIFTPIWMSMEEYYASAMSTAPVEIEQAGKIYVKDQYLFVNEVLKGIHVIDNSDPAAPKPVSFINILGNIDMAVKGNYLYADSYSDLLVFNISNPLDVRVEKRIPGVINYPTTTEGLVLGYHYAQQDSLIVGYTSRDTTYNYDCAQTWPEMMFDASAQSFASALKSNSGGGTGKGGSMARFTIAKDHLYTVNYSQLKAFDLGNSADPAFKGEQQIGWAIETIFPYGEYLFIGSSNAMYIYDIDNPAAPAKRSTVTHFTACDPVVVEGTTAYVTLRTGTTCAGTFNELQVFNVADVDNPVKLATYQMKNPHGLGIDNGKLFICEGVHGLRFLDAPDPLKIKTTKLVEGVNAYDVIPYNQGLIVSAVNGIYQYDYKNMSNPVLLSKINVKNAE